MGGKPDDLDRLQKMSPCDQLGDQDPLKYSTFWRRFWAGLIDGLVFTPLVFLDGYMQSLGDSDAFLLGWSAISSSAGWIYSVWLHARYGQTLGKMAMRVKVLDISEVRIPTLQQAFLRDIGRIVLDAFSFGYSAYLVLTSQYSEVAVIRSLPGRILGVAGLSWFGIEVVTMLMSKKRRALHDFIARTVVVRL